jgi:hypothetical protein
MRSNAVMLAVFACLVVCAIGCGAETRTYEVSVRNVTSGPVTIWLYKDGGPDEEGWKSPEDLAIDSPKADEPIGGRIIAPRVVATAGPVTGHFDADSNAVLRVYRGSHPFNELLAIGGDSGDRIDVKLFPSQNNFLIQDRDHKLLLYRVPEIPTGPPAP